MPLTLSAGKKSAADISIIKQKGSTGMEQENSICQAAENKSVSPNVLLQLMQQRRSIRKYQNRQISKEDLATILQAGASAPNAGGGQRSILLAMHSEELCRKVGIWNAACMNRKNLLGSYVSAEQPSLIDDPSIKSGFYGAPTVVAVFGPSNFLYSIPDAFCAAENMVLMAQSLGLASCIVARGEQTFDHPAGKELLESWNIPEGYVCCVFVLLGYLEGHYPKAKPVKEGRIKIAE
jgi:nitroreductase